MTSKIVGYIRVSTSKQEHGLEVQKQAIEIYANENNLEIVSIYIEKVSGKNDNRIELNKAIADTKINNAQLVVAKLDRLSRNVGFIFTLRDAKVNFIALDLREFNTMTLAIFASVAQHERELISARTKEGLRIAKQRGQHLGGVRLNSSNTSASNIELARQQSVINRKESAMAESLNASKIIERELERKTSLQAIADFLNSINCKTSKGKDFTKSSVQHVIKLHGLKK